MGSTVTPNFNMSRKQISEFAKDPRTIRDFEALQRLAAQTTPDLLAAKVDETRQILTDSTLTGGGNLTNDLTLGIELTSEAERIRDVIGAALIDTPTIDFTADDAGDTIKADLKNTTITAGTYGDATHVSQVTFDAQGRATGAANIAISFPSVSSGGGLLAANNLSDVANVTTARSNLGLGTAATHAATDFLQVSNNLSDLGSAAAARDNLGLHAVTTQSGTSYTAVLADADTYVRFSNASAITFTIPPNSSVAFPVGTTIQMEQAGAGALSVAAGSGVTINSRAADLTLAGQYAVAFVKKVATDTWTMNGDL